MESCGSLHKIYPNISNYRMCFSDMFYIFIKTLLKCELLNEIEPYARYKGTPSGRFKL